MAGFGAKVKLSVDRSTEEKAKFNKQINGMINQIKISNKFVVLQQDIDNLRADIETKLNNDSIKITKIDCSKAVDKLRNDLQNVINSLSIKNGVSITGLIDPAGVGTIGTKIDEVAAAANKGQAEVDRFNAQLTVLKQTMNTLASSYKTIMPGGKNSTQGAAQLENITKEYTELQAKIESVNNAQRNGSIVSTEEMGEIQQKAFALQNEISLIDQARIATEQAEKAKKDAIKETEKAEKKRTQAKKEDERAEKRRNAEQQKAEREAAASAKRQLQAQKDYNSMIEKLNNLITQSNKNLNSWTAAKKGKTKESYNKILALVGEAKDLLARVSNADHLTDEMEVDYAEIRRKINSESSTIKGAHEDRKSFTDRIGTLANKFTSWLTISQTIMQVYRSLKKVVDAVIAIDTAMTELRKVTDETDATYRTFLDNASTRAKTVGSSIADTINATADFARLGYDIWDAEKLADAAIIYKNVGDGIDDINTASESVIATMQAFSVLPEDVMSIVDRFNKVGNEFAISSKGVGDALLRSASAMKAANNTLDETIALTAAANTVVKFVPRYYGNIAA